MSSTVTVAQPTEVADPRKDMLLNGSIDKLPIVCDSMEELIHEVRKYSDNDSYFMQIFPMFIDRVFGEKVMDNPNEATWMRGDRGGWLKKSAETTRSSFSISSSRQNMDMNRSRRPDRTSGYSSQMGMTDYAGRLLQLFALGGCVSKVVNDDHYNQHFLNVNFEILPKKVKLKCQGLSAYRCVRSANNHALYDQWCHRSSSIVSNLMSTPNRNNTPGGAFGIGNSRVGDGTLANNTTVNLPLQSYFFMAFIRYPTVDVDIFPQSRQGNVELYRNNTRYGLSNM